MFVCVYIYIYVEIYIDRQLFISSPRIPYAYVNITFSR